MIQPNINNYDEAFKGKILILNPDTREFVQLDEWRKEKDPTRAEVVTVDTPYYRIAIHKNFVGERMNFKTAQETAGTVEILGQKCRCPRRIESIYIYDARFNGLDDAIDLIGGDSRSTIWWTCDEDAEGWFARRNSANHAWFFNGTHGYLGSSSVNIANRCQAVTLFDLSEAK